LSTKVSPEIRKLARFWSSKVPTISVAIAPVA
jgi:hypothetical protein